MMGTQKLFVDERKKGERREGEGSKSENSNEERQKDRVETPDHRRRCVLGVEKNKVGKSGRTKGKKGLSKVRAESLI